MVQLSIGPGMWGESALFPNVYCILECVDQPLAWRPVNAGLGQAYCLECCPFRLLTLGT